ncbi:MAG: FAD-dependent oxidoreductase, partial [Pseudomonadota bacterium]|nr:FAD-dependent oxidoreductase [Pseudomonadota bacterium]
DRFEGLGVTIIRERASFAGRNKVQSTTHKVSARYIVIATGSSPLLPAIVGLDRTPFHTNETIFADPEKPDHLLIIGGGPIGIEMAQAHARLGCRVTVIEAATIMGRDDAKLVEILKTRLIGEGITLVEGVGVTEVAKSKVGVTATLANGAVIEASQLLVAVGRRPATEGLDLAAAGIAVTPAGITTDKRLRTSNKRVFAIGDVTGREQFTHMAGYHASVVIRNMLFKMPAKLNDSIVPWVTYSDPELAQVGLTENAATDKWGEASIRIMQVPLAEVDRAIAERRREGMLKIIVHRNGRILGASILAPNAGEMILAWVLAISSRQKIKQMASIIAPYPTYGDASKKAASQFFTEKLFSQRTRRIVQFLLRW